MSCKNCKKRNLKEQYPENSKGGGMGGTNTSSSGEYISGGAWDQKGPFFKTKRETPKTEVKEVDITGGEGNAYKGYTKGLSIDQIPTDNQSPTPNIETTDDVGPQYAIINTQDNGYRDPYDDDNPDPYDRKRPRPKKTKPEKAWRSPPCCRPCGGGKWKRDCGELERAPGSKKSNSTGCRYNSYSDCQLAGKSLSEQTSADSSGQYTSPEAWEAGGILTTSTGNQMVGSETLDGAPTLNISDDFKDIDVTVLSLADIFDGGEDTNYEDDEVSFDILPNNEDEEMITMSIDVEEIPEEDEEYLRNLHENKSKPKFKRSITESIYDINNMMTRMSLVEMDSVGFGFDTDNKHEQTLGIAKPSDKYDISDEEKVALQNPILLKNKKYSREEPVKAMRDAEKDLSSDLYGGPTPPYYEFGPSEDWAQYKLPVDFYDESDEVQIDYED